VFSVQCLVFSVWGLGFIVCGSGSRVWVVGLLAEVATLKVWSETSRTEGVGVQDVEVRIE